jgi:hypothetical protein
MATLERVERHSGVLQGGALIETVAGVGTVALAIIGLAGMLPREFAAIATMAVAVALMAEGGTVAARLARMTRETAAEGADEFVGGGVSAEVLAGMAGFVLGLLAVLGVAPVALPAIAAIVFGGGLVIGSTATSRISSTTFGYASIGSGVVFREALAATVGTQLLVALASIALGIIAVVGIHSTVITLVALLSLGSAVLLSGTAVGAAMMSVFRR